MVMGNIASQVYRVGYRWLSRPVASLKQQLRFVLLLVAISFKILTSHVRREGRTT